jgi:hypothetical protein
MQGVMRFAQIANGTIRTPFATGLPAPRPGNLTHGSGGLDRVVAWLLPSALVCCFGDDSLSASANKVPG